MIVQEIQGERVPVTGEDIVFENGDHASYATVLLWTEEERNARGLFTVEDPQVAIDPQREARTAYAMAQDVVFGCILTGKTVPADWKAYGAAARQIIGGIEGVVLPPLPAPPAGV